MKRRTDEGQRPPFEIFRGSDAISLTDSGMLTDSSSLDTYAREIGLAMQAGITAGSFTRVLFSNPRFSVAYLWYKSGYPLPRHTHNCDCLYLVIHGSLKIGSETLLAGDGFFVGSEVPYGYTAGEDGVEVLEFRSTSDFDIKIMAGAAFWRRAVETASIKQPAWALEEPPALARATL